MYIYVYILEILQCCNGSRIPDCLRKVKYTENLVCSNLLYVCSLYPIGYSAEPRFGYSFWFDLSDEQDFLRKANTRVTWVVKQCEIYELEHGPFKGGKILCGFFFWPSFEESKQTNWSNLADSEFKVCFFLTILMVQNSRDTTYETYEYGVYMRIKISRSYFPSKSFPIYKKNRDT